MNRQWKPGDVALVKNEWNVWNIAICTLRSDQHGYWWRYGVAESFSPIVADARPLVVIDPEDEAAVDSVANAIRDHHGRDNVRVWVGIDWIATQNALRALANPQPPKPEEPQGLGAVVEDENGEQWVRHRGQIAPWHRADGQPTERPWRYYNDIDAVRVLSEGVQ